MRQLPIILFFFLFLFIWLTMGVHHCWIPGCTSKYTYDDQRALSKHQQTCRKRQIEASRKKAVVVQRVKKVQKKRDTHIRVPKMATDEVPEASGSSANDELLVSLDSSLSRFGKLIIVFLIVSTLCQSRTYAGYTSCKFNTARPYSGKFLLSYPVWYCSQHQSE
jgi:hypothetical protein